MDVRRPQHEDVDLGEVIVVGLEASYDDLPERIRAFWETARSLRRRGMDYVAAHLEHYVELRKEACLEARICPYCGEDLEVVNDSQYHPYGAGSAREERYLLRCRIHGEV